VRRQYFFGYLFVRARKQLALLVMAIAAGFCVLEYSQAKTSASAAAYQPSTSLHRALGNLTDSFSGTERIVSSFDADHQLAAPKVQRPSFPTIIASNADFAAIDQTLSTIDRQRDLLKQSIISRFEVLVRNIEAKLRAYAAGVEGASPSPAPPAASVVVSAASVAGSSQVEGSVFSTRLSASDINKRSSELNARMEFLKVLETKAENPENRTSLTEAVAQLEGLSKLLPEKQETSGQGEPASPGSSDAAEQAHKNLPSERVAAQLEQLRSQVRQIFLTSWNLDEAFEQAADLASAERDKCRVAALAEKGIWLSTISRVLVALLVASLASFVILVCADLVKTFLDTASHTGVVAEAVNAIRGSTIIAKNQVRQEWPSHGNEMN
jgi:hypothetical protein